MMMKNKIMFALLFGVCGLCFAQVGNVVPAVESSKPAAPAAVPATAAPKAVAPAATPAANVQNTTNSVVDNVSNPANTVGEQISNPANEVGNDGQIPTEIVDAPAASEEIQPEPVPAEPAPVQGKPKIAVYVTGGKDVAENKALGTYILEALVRSDRYVAIERSEAFLAEIDNEQFAQRSGAIDDAQISRLGKQSGVQFVCVADITQALRAAQVSARVLDVETAEVSAVGTAESPLRTMDDLKRVSTEVVCVMLGIMPKRERRVRFAGRLAYGNSYVSKYSAQTVRYYENEYESTLLFESRYNRMGAGSGFEAGISTIVGLTDGLSVEVGTAFAWRRPVSVEGGALEVVEYAVTVPALLRGRVFKSPAYVQGGVQLDIPFNATKKDADGGKTTLDDRESFDFGLIIGAGWQFRQDMQADVRAVHGLRGFDGQNNHLLYSVSAGVSYLY